MSEMTGRLVETLKRVPIRDNVNPGGELDELRLREAVRQILLVIREPTEAMLALHEQMAGNELCDNATAEILARVHRALIDASLT